MTTDDSQCKLLIVDDHPENIRALMDAVGGEHKVIVAKDGKKALERAFKFLPDLILLDIMMPGMDGFEVCKILKDDEKTKDIPIIFVTAMDADQYEEKGLRLGAIDYIRKPFNLAVTKTRINNHLNLKRKTDMLEKMARIDGLTEINNRRGLDEALVRQWKSSMRYRSELSLIMIDIDFFKNYNDHYGHSQGDVCLFQVAQSIKRSTKRPRDFVARYGGEEFAVLLPNTGREGALLIAEAIRKNIEELSIPHGFSAVHHCVTVSVGVAVMVPEEGNTELSLIIRSDQALYMSKESGRNRVSILDSDSL